MKIFPQYFNQPGESGLEGKLQTLFQKMYDNSKIEYKNKANEVLFDGNPRSKIMFIGEAPGEDEVIQKKPFVGKSGKLLQQMLDAAGISRELIYITNTIIWRPPNNRTPLPEEIAEMRPYLLEHIELINPAILVCVGGIAYKSVADHITAISKIRGQWIGLGSRKLITIFHPSYLLRSREHKKETWMDVLNIRTEAIKTGIQVGSGCLDIQN